MLKVEYTDDITRIKRLLETEHLAQQMAQFDNESFIIHDIDLTKYQCFVASKDGEDIGIFIAEKMSYDRHFSIHVGFLKKARGFLAFAAAKLFVQVMQQLYDYATLFAMPPGSKIPACIMAKKAGFDLVAIIPHAIATVDRSLDKAKFEDQYIFCLRW